MRKLLDSFRRHYGSGPLHLVMLLACFAFAGYVASIVAQVPQAARIAIWFVGAAIVHDFVLWPLYTAADRVTGIGARLAARRSRPVGSRAPVPWTNHVRVPAVLSGVLLIISFPLVLNRSGRTYRTATGLSPSPYTAHWLAIVAVLFGLSALAYLARLAWHLLRPAAPPPA